MLEFYLRVMGVFDKYDCHDLLFWRCNFNGQPLKLIANVSDIFAWGCTDGEDITPENIDCLEQAFADCYQAKGYIGACHAVALFAARVRQKRPQGAAYPQEAELWPLFDACGPERTVGLGNPRPHPSQIAPQQA